MAQRVLDVSLDYNRVQGGKVRAKYQKLLGSYTNPHQRNAFNLQVARISKYLSFQIYSSLKFY